MIGQMLGPYQVLSKVGEGGMGEVYRARDTRLDRTVAIKILPAELSADPDRRVRFEREARAVAALSHPHICTLHDIGTHPSTGSGQATVYLVMEYLQGETLAARLAKGPLPLDEALTVGAEIADALAAAHRQQVIHRDLKPGNIMLTKAGAKLLDFGLAKLQASGAASPSVALSSLRTQEPATQAGLILGTVPYMAPEQLEGKDTDARSDIFSFGAVLYEMVTGRRPFAGESQASIISAIMLSQPPPLSSIQPVTPPALDRIVRKCLAKDPETRWQSATDLADELRWMRDASGITAAPAVGPSGRRRLRTASLVAGLIVAAAGAGAGVTWWLRPAAPTPAVAHLSVQVGDADELNAGGESGSFIRTPGGATTALAWTPDGRALVFVGRRGAVQQLYVRMLDAATARPLAGTEGARLPAISPDGQWVAFWAGGAIRKVALGGGPITDVASGLRPTPWGLTWDASDRLFFGRWHGPIGAISLDGKIEAVTKLGDTERSHGFPRLLPGGRVLLFTVRKREESWGDEEIIALTLTTGQRKVLLKDASDARYVPTGHLVFLRRGTLHAAPFDPEHLEVGTPVPLLDHVAQALPNDDMADLSGAGQFAISAGGTLAWLSAPVPAYPDAALVTLDRSGRITPLPAPARSYFVGLRLSPDGRRLAVMVRSMTEVGLWVCDLERGTLGPLTMDGEAYFPRWSPDGGRVVFNWIKDGVPSLATRLTDGARPVQVLVPGAVFPSSFSRDGQLLAVAQGGMDNSGGDRIVLVTEENGQAGARTVIETDKAERSPELSPDGRWLAYQSFASGRSEVYVRPYPGEGLTAQVSVEGGWNAAWNPANGRELFFVQVGRPSHLMAVDFTPGSPPRFGLPRPLFEFDPRALDFIGAPVRSWDVSPDGQRFYVIQRQTPPPPPVVTHINLIQNWFEELKRKVPAQAK